MKLTKNEFIDFVKFEVGNDYKKYCQNFGYTYRIEWCAVFVCYCLNKCGVNQVYSPSCNTLINKLSDKFYTDRNFKTGDLIFYNWDGDKLADHIGIVTDINGNMLEVVEGNMHEYPNDIVGLRYIDKNSSLIFGRCCLFPENVCNTNYDTIRVNVPELAKSEKYSDAVRYMQILLHHVYKYTDLEIDGYFGSKTEFCVKQFQARCNLVSDGICGINTWTALLKFFE